MYNHERQYVWVEWTWDGEGDPPEFDYTGFRAKVLKNPNGRETNLEQGVFRTWWDDKENRALRDDYYKVIAPRVVEWEYALNGEPVPAPGESEDNWEAFHLLPLNLALWLVFQVRLAHLPKAMTPASTPAGNTEPASPTETLQETALPPS